MFGVSGFPFFVSRAVLQFQDFAQPMQPASTTRALATATQWCATLFAALSWAAERNLGQFIALNVANTAWSFATTARWDTAFFVALAMAAERGPGTFSPQAVANATWAFGTAAARDAALSMAFASPASQL